jgi:hypothetical protein
MTPQRKTAEDVVNSVMLQKNPKWYEKGTDGISDWGLLSQELTEALTAFASQARNEVLEEAAKIVDGCGCNDKNCEQAWGAKAERIRGLKR